MARITVDQTLHGYSEGHRLIRGSVKLPQSDARTMLMLSDASGSGSRIPDGGYLTGYPLVETGRYVLARTWTAPEMSRPGCVWTHSLLIDFSDLARVGSADGLVDLFRRPSGDAALGFSASLDVEVARTPQAASPADVARLRQWVTALYGRPRSRIVDDREDERDDSLLLAIWLQQWPRLRRSFRFSSFSTDDRSTSTDAFDLQLVAGGRPSRARMSEATPAASVDGGDWVGTVVDDLELPAGSGMRQFLRDVGADVTGGRAAMIPLVRLHVALEPSARPRELADAVSGMERLGPTQGRLARAAAARAIFARADVSDRSLFDFALDQVAADRTLLGLDPLQIGEALLRWRPDLLADAVQNDGPLRPAAVSAIARAGPDELIGVLAGVPEAASVILEMRPDLFRRPLFWQTAAPDAPSFVRRLDLGVDDADAVVAALVEAGRDDCAVAAIDRWGLRPALAALSSLGTTELEARVPWLQSVSRRTDELADCMAAGAVSHRPLLIALAKTLDPDAVPNQVGTDPWVTAVRLTGVSPDVGGEDVLAAFLFKRARGWRSRSAGGLFFLSVQRLHEAMASVRLSDEAWQIMQGGMPWGSIWRDWDRCEKLRHAVVDQFVDRDLPPVEFGTVVDDGWLWAQLVALAADTSSGRRYLDKVRKALRTSDVNWWQDRAKLIERRIR